MLRKQRRETAVVSAMLVTIPITLILTLTVSATTTAIATAIKERPTEFNSTTPTTKATKGDVETATVFRIGEEGNEKTTTAAETTTTAFLTLQPPPFNVTSPTTTSSYEPASKSKSKSESAAATAAEPQKLNDVTGVESSSPTKNSINHETNKTSNVAVKSVKESAEKDDTEAENKQKFPKELVKVLTDDFNSVPFTHEELRSNDSQSTIRPKQISTPRGYINFEPKDSIELIAKEKQEKAQTVNKVLTSLFPNGFSDIFRFSYTSEKTTPTPTMKSTSENSLSTEATTKASTPTSEQKPSFRYTTSVSKEYRRLLGPGHTEIVVEKLVSPNLSEEFNDGSNSINKNELLRINRAAVDSPVLPSLLVEPSKLNETATPNAPIVILKENSSEHDDLIDEAVDDNLIAESQDHVQHVFQRLPDTNAKQNYKHKVPEVNVEIIHDETLRPDHKGIFGQRLFTPAAELSTKELKTNGAVSTPLNHFQQDAQQAYPEPTPEAPSRKFLKNFNPQLSESASGLVKKGNFHYESIGRQQRLQTSTTAPGDYTGLYIKPAAQLQYQKQSKQQQQPQSPNTDNEKLHTHITSSQNVNPNSDFKGYDATPIHEIFTPPPNTPESVVFVTVNTQRTNAAPKPTPLPLLPPDLLNKSPHDYVAEAVGAASQTQSQSVQEPNRNLGYTYVEVQKSVNIHNKLITEKDGQLVEQHETIYHQPEYAKNFRDVSVAPKDYDSLSAHPINVQHIDEIDGEKPEEAASHTASHQVPQPVQDTQINYVEELVSQPNQVAVENIVDHPNPLTQVVENPDPASYPVAEFPDKAEDRPIEVEKVVDRPVKVPYPVQVNHYIDRPYPVREIIEQPVAVPYAVPEPVAVPVPIETYIDRPYPVETIVEKRIPYPVEKVVEKIVEKQVPIEVERIVEKPQVVEKVVEKLVDRPVAIPIHVPVAVPVPPYPPHPNALTWTSGTSPPQRYQKIPPKVLQSYYTRMLKKLLDPQNPNLQGVGHSSVAPVVPVINVSQTTKVTKPTQPPAPIQFTKPPFKISDIRMDLKPPPPPLGPSWSKGARYIYNTLPAHLTTALIPDQDYGPQQQIFFVGTLPTAQSSEDVSHDEFQRWRNGHVLKRSPDFGRNLQIEYGFKPPLVPSLEIDENGMPLKSGLTKTDE